MPYRSHYCGPRVASQGGILLLAAFVLGGCSFISIDVSEFTRSEPSLATGSARTDVEITAPIPESLAYSDAVVIGQLTARTLVTTMPAEPVQWTNGETGSSGTWAPASSAPGRSNSECRTFETTVTSISGVRKFVGSACRSDGEVVKLETLKLAAVDNS